MVSEYSNIQNAFTKEGAGVSFFLYARLKNGRIMLYPSASVRPSVNFLVSV